MQAIGWFVCVCVCVCTLVGFPCKESACNAGSIPGLERSSGEGHGNSLQLSCLENPMDRGAWWAAVQGVARVGHDLTHVFCTCTCAVAVWLVTPRCTSVSYKSLLSVWRCTEKQRDKSKSKDISFPSSNRETNSLRITSRHRCNYFKWSDLLRIEGDTFGRADREEIERLCILWLHMRVKGCTSFSRDG